MISEDKWQLKKNAQSTQWDSLFKDFGLNGHQIQLTKAKLFLQKLNTVSQRWAAFFPDVKQLMRKTLIQPLLSVSYRGVLLNLSYAGSQVKKFCYQPSWKGVEKSTAKKDKKPHQNQPFQVFKTGKQWLIMNDESSLIYPVISLISNLTAGQKLPLRAIDY